MLDRVYRWVMGLPGFWVCLLVEVAVVAAAVVLVLGVIFLSDFL